MKIAFFGSAGSFNYHKIGGVDAYVRRLSNEFSKTMDSIFLINYGNETYSEEIVNDKIKIYQFENLERALTFISTLKLSHTIVTYIPRSDRGKFKQFQKENKHINTSLLLTVYHNNPLKRKLAYLQAVNNPYYKYFFCISQRICNAVSKYSKRALTILPPVDDTFYSKYSNTKENLFRIGYMGRLDYGKGADLAIKYFTNSKLDRDKYSFSIYSYPWKSDPHSMAMHQDLINQKTIFYEESKVKKYTAKVDVKLSQIIDSVDLFFLPYRTLSSTIDTPLVPLEILSRKKLFISTDEGVMKQLSGNHKLIVDTKINVESLDHLIKHCEENFNEIVMKNSELNLEYKTSQVALNILALIKNGSSK